MDLWAYNNHVRMDFSRRRKPGRKLAELMVRFNQASHIQPFHKSSADRRMPAGHDLRTRKTMRAMISIVPRIPPPKIM
jgi:hypothetical protein